MTYKWPISWVKIFLIQNSNICFSCILRVIFGFYCIGNNFNHVRDSNWSKRFGRQTSARLGEKMVARNHWFMAAMQIHWQEVKKTHDYSSYESSKIWMSWNFQIATLGERSGRGGTAPKPPKISVHFLFCFLLSLHN